MCETFFRLPGLSYRFNVLDSNANKNQEQVIKKVDELPNQLNHTEQKFHLISFFLCFLVCSSFPCFILFLLGGEEGAKPRKLSCLNRSSRARGLKHDAKIDVS